MHVSFRVSHNRRTSRVGAITSRSDSAIVISSLCESASAVGKLRIKSFTTTADEVGRIATAPLRHVEQRALELA